MVAENGNEKMKEWVIFDEFHDPGFSLALALLVLCM
jgi:hypothetical protein